MKPSAVFCLGSHCQTIPLHVEMENMLMMVKLHHRSILLSLQVYYRLVGSRFKTLQHICWLQRARKGVWVAYSAGCVRFVLCISLSHENRLRGRIDVGRPDWASGIDFLCLWPMTRGQQYIRKHLFLDKTFLIYGSMGKTLSEEDLAIRGIWLSFW